MKRASFQGTGISAAQRRRLELERSINPGRYAPVDWSGIRREFDSRLFVGPPAPVAVLVHSFDDGADVRYWRLASEFKRFGYSEVNESGTPFVGDAFGY